MRVFGSVQTQENKRSLGKRAGKPVTKLYSFMAIFALNVTKLDKIDIKAYFELPFFFFVKLPIETNEKYNRFVKV